MNFHYSTLCETFGGIGNNVVNIIRKHKKCFHFVVRNYIDALSSCVYFSSNTSVEVLPSVDLQPIEDTSLNSVSTSTSANKLKKAFYFHKYPFLPRYPYFQSYILDRSVAEIIAQVVTKNQSLKGGPILEVNPGPGVLTQAFFNSGVQHILGCESLDQFMPYLSLWMGIGKDMLAVNVHSNKSYVCFSSISWKSYCCNKVEDLHSAGHRSLVIEKCDFFLSLLGLPCSNDNRVVMKDLVSNFLTSCDYEKGVQYAQAVMEIFILAIGLEDELGLLCIEDYNVQRILYTQAYGSILSIFGVLPINRPYFFKQLMLCLGDLNGLFTVIYPELFLLVPAKQYRQLFTTSIENTSYTNLYTVQCIGLVLFFEYELLAELWWRVQIGFHDVAVMTPIEQGFNHIYEKRLTCDNLLSATCLKAEVGSYAHLQHVSSNMSYLVRIRIRDKLPLPREDIHTFSMFMSQICRKKRQRLVPKMEQLVPGCGMHLILQGYSMMDMICDLSPSQFIEIFQLIRHCPEFSGSALEQYLSTEAH